MAKATRPPRSMTEAFPAFPSHRMAEQIIKRDYVEERMNEPGIPDIGLGRLDQSLAKIAAPWVQTAHKQKVDKNVDVAANHWRRDFKRPGEP